MMNNIRRKYTRGFKLEAMRVPETSGRNAAQIERELSIGDGCLSRWRKESRREDAASARADEGGVEDRDRIRQLEREDEILCQERDILKNAVAIFSPPSI